MGKSSTTILHIPVDETAASCSPRGAIWSTDDNNVKILMEEPEWPVPESQENRPRKKMSWLQRKQRGW